MADNKNQHYVPRCYLRPFTTDEKNVAINLWNIDRSRFIQGAPVKNQCSKSYFYGKNDRLEEAIQMLEREYASAYRRITKPGALLSEDDKHALKLFWLFQYLRTEEASKRSMAASGAIVKDIKINEVIPELSMADAVQICMNVFAENITIVDDLKICLIRNKTNIPFVTSDDPAILTNRWVMLNPRMRGRSFGLRQSGLLAILPLSPEICFVAYDGDVYSMPNTNGWINIKRDAEADAFNQHQYLNCRANLYIRDPNKLPLIIDGFNKVKDSRVQSRHAITFAAFDYSDGIHRRYVVVEPEIAQQREDVVMHLETIHPKPTHWPVSIQWRNKGAVFTNGTGHGYVRRNFIDSLGPPAFFKQPTFS